MRRKKLVLGFTLIEIMLVMTIIVILLGTAIFKFTPLLDWVKANRVEGDIRGIRANLELYASKSGFYPSTEQGLKALVVKPNLDPVPENWMPLMDSVPKDPWGSDYVYRCPGQRNPVKFDLFSAGPDRKPDTDDDIWVR